MKNSLKLFILIGLSLLLAVHFFAQDAQSKISTKENLAETVNAVPCKNEERLEGVKKAFISVGAKAEEITVETFDKGKLLNVVVTKKGKTDETIVVGAHYDKTADGCGAIDNWTGISIIAHLYKTISQFDTQKTIVFVAFDKEEIGLLGSDAMAKNIPKEKRINYCAMINFDSFGFTAPYVLRGASSPKLIDFADKYAKEINFKLGKADIAGADTDSSSFKSHDIPAIDFSGIDGNWRNYLHTSNDKLKHINIDSVYLGYRFGLAFLAKLDASLCREQKK